MHETRDFARIGCGGTGRAPAWPAMTPRALISLRAHPTGLVANCYQLPFGQQQMTEGRVCGSIRKREIRKGGESGAAVHSEKAQREPADQSPAHRGRPRDAKEKLPDGVIANFVKWWNGRARPAEGQRQPRWAARSTLPKPQVLGVSAPKASPPPRREECRLAKSDIDRICWRSLKRRVFRPSRRR